MLIDSSLFVNAFPQRAQNVVPLRSIGLITLYIRFNTTALLPTPTRRTRARATAMPAQLRDLTRARVRFGRRPDRTSGSRTKLGRAWLPRGHHDVDPRA